MQLLAQLFTGPVEEATKVNDIEPKAKTETLITKEEAKDLQIEDQLEPNLFNVMDFH